MPEIINQITTYITKIPSILVFFLALLLGLFVFWRGTVETYKNRSAVFDGFIFSSILAIIFGRISFIINEWSSFSKYIWYWLPYEKYGDQIYMFRLLPWRFFAVWDGGIVIFVLFFGFLIAAWIYSSLIKKWKWSHMFFPIFWTGDAILGFSTLFYGLLLNSTGWMIKGGILLVLPFLYLVFYNLIEKIVKNQEKEKSFIIYSGVVILLAVSVFISYIFLEDVTAISEKIPVYAFLIWSVLGSMFAISSMKEGNIEIEKISSVMSTPKAEPELNKPIKIQSR